MTVRMIDWADGFPLTAGPRTLGVSEAAPETREYWLGIEHDEVRLKWCAACASHLHPRRIVCPHCGSDDLGWRRANGRGMVYTFSEIMRAPAKDMAASVPYAVGIVLLDEGVHLFTRFFTGDGASLRIDAPAMLEFRVLERGEKLPVWVVSST